MKVYRLECIDCGYGPYQCNCGSLCDCDDVKDRLSHREHPDHCKQKQFHSWFERMQHEHSNMETHPSMVMDAPNVGKLTKDYYCGFSSRAMLRRWFGKYLNLFYDIGYSVVTYNVHKDYIIKGKSRKQLFFLRDSAA